MGKTNAAPSELIEMRRFIMIGAVSADFTHAVIIRENKDDIGLIGCRREESRTRFQAGKKKCRSEYFLKFYS